MCSVAHSHIRVSNVCWGADFFFYSTAATVVLLGVFALALTWWRSSLLQNIARCVPPVVGIYVSGLCDAAGGGFRPEGNLYAVITLMAMLVGVLALVLIWPSLNIMALCALPVMALFSSKFFVKALRGLGQNNDRYTVVAIVAMLGLFLSVILIRLLLDGVLIVCFVLAYGLVSWWVIGWAEKTWKRSRLVY